MNVQFPSLGCFFSGNVANTGHYAVIVGSGHSTAWWFFKTYWVISATFSRNYSGFWAGFGSCFGRDPEFLDQKLLPFLKKGGYVYIAVPGMKEDCHSHLPPELLLSWTPEQLDYMHDVAYGKGA